MTTLHDIRIKNANRLIIGHSNVNSLRYKFEMLEALIKDIEALIKDKIDIFLTSERKVDSCFPSGQFVIKDYSAPFRLDRNQNRGGYYFMYVKTSHVRFGRNTFLKNLLKIFS